METKEGFGMVTFKLNPGDRWGAAGRGTGRSRKWEKTQSRVFKKKKWE